MFMGFVATNVRGIIVPKDDKLPKKIDINIKLLTILATIALLLFTVVTIWRF